MPCCGRSSLQFAGWHGIIWSSWRHWNNVYFLSHPLPKGTLKSNGWLVAMTFYVHQCLRWTIKSKFLLLTDGQMERRQMSVASQALATIVQSHRDRFALLDNMLLLKSYSEIWHRGRVCKFIDSALKSRYLSCLSISYQYVDGNKFVVFLQGIEGFDELRQIVKTGCDGSRELAAIIADR